MRTKLGFALFSGSLLLTPFNIQAAAAQTLAPVRGARIMVSKPIDESQRVALTGNTRPEVRPENDHGRVPDNFPMEHMLLQLRRPPELEQALQQFIDGLHTSESPNFHHWLTAKEFGARFGPAEQDLATVTGWLQSHGFRVNVVYPSGMVVDFSGTAGQVRSAFQTEIHRLEVKGEKHIANNSDPKIPAALAPLVSGIVSLHDFRPHNMHHLRKTGPQYTFPDASGSTSYAVVPTDLATIYNLNPLFEAGYSGQGQTVVLVENTDVFSTSDWSTFRSVFGLSSYSSTFTTVHPAPTGGGNNCRAPGVVAPNDAEAILDTEWASAASPSADIELASCGDTTTTFGGLIAVQNLINANAPPAIMSISYGECETLNGSSSNAAYNSAYQQAVAEGISVFVAAGDSGASGCDNSAAEATHGIVANAFASTPYDVAVGGTDFSDTYSGTNSTYWNLGNTPDFGSAISYIPETPWNDSCAGALLAHYLNYSTTYGTQSLCNDPLIGPLVASTVGGGGAPSRCATGTPSSTGVVGGSCQGWPKPSWQAVVGNPSDGVRDTPDVSLFAADGLWGHYYIFCWSDIANGGTACTGSPSNWSGAGGTSFATPIMAGVQALVNQATASRQGNPNPTYYQLAASEYGTSGSGSCNSSSGNTVSGSCIFYDVTLGDMDVDCAGPDCYLGGGSLGVLSTSGRAFMPAYAAAMGWDFATGIGSVNAANLVNSWPGARVVPTFVLSASPSSSTLTQGASSSSSITVIPQNGFSGSVALSASGLPSGVTASFSPNPATSGSTLTLSAGSSATTGTASVTITGSSGSLRSTTVISLTVNPAPAPDFTLSASPANLSLIQGASGSSSITLTPQNGFNGSVTLSASGLPNGVTASFSPNPTTSGSTLTLTAGSSATTGTASVTITGVSGSLSHSTPLSLTVKVVPTLPSVWADGDIGAPSVAGSASYGNNVFTVSGAGTQIYGTTDAFHFVYQALSGDGSIVARVVSQQGASGYGSAGVMLRETLSATASNAKTSYWPAYHGIYFDARTTTGGNTVEPGSLAATLPYWVKVTRSGNVFTSYASLDGVNWTQLGASQSIPMASTIYAGLAVNSGSSSTAATVTFDNVSVGSAAAPAPTITGVSATTGAIGSPVVITGTGFGATQGGSLVLLQGMPVTVNSWSATSINVSISNGAISGPLLVSLAPAMNDSNPVIFTVTSQPLPTPWLDQDVGSLGVIGQVGFANGSFTVQSAGTQIYGTADAFHFVYQPLSGDGTIVARIVSVQGASGYGSAGVMLRQTLSASSSNAKTSFYPAYKAVYFDVRSNNGSSTAEPGGLPVTLPYWLKVTRSGNIFTSSISSDGANWVQLGASQTISMASTIYLGLAVNSGSNSTATATFDNVSVTSP